MTKWLGPAAWGKKEAKAGDRLPYACHVDAATLRLRDGSLMRSMRLAGFPFETEDDDVLNHLLAVRDVVLRSALNSKAVLYHHVIRRRVEVDLGARNPDPVSTEIDRRWTAQLNQGRLFLNEQFLTIVIRPPRGKAGLPERLSKLGAKPEGALTSGEALDLDSATAALTAALQSYGVRVLGTYETETGVYSEPLELLSAHLQRRDPPGAAAAARAGPWPAPALFARQLRPRRARGARARAARLRQHPRHQGISRRQPRRPAGFAASRSA